MNPVIGEAAGGDTKSGQDVSDEGETEIGKW